MEGFGGAKWDAVFGVVERAGEGDYVRGNGVGGRVLEADSSVSGWVGGEEEGVWG